MFFETPVQGRPVKTRLGEDESLLLIKLQTVRIVEKDIKDLTVLMREHHIGYHDDKAKVNLQSLKDHDLFDDGGSTSLQQLTLTS